MNAQRKGQPSKQAFTAPAKEWWLEWRTPLGNPHCPYAWRWLIGTPLGSLRLHLWRGSDDSRAYHDHPWSFITLVLWGSYTDLTPQGAELMAPGTVRYRPARHVHSVQLASALCWTLVLAGREHRHWGFITWAGRWLKANKYFHAHGHHPCTS